MKITLCGFKNESSYMFLVKRYHEIENEITINGYRNECLKLWGIRFALTYTYGFLGIKLWVIKLDKYLISFKLKIGSIFIIYN